MPFDKHAPSELARWSVAQARRLYNIDNWNGGYFTINDQGRLIATCKDLPRCRGVDLYALAEDLNKQGLTPPVLVRFQHILRDRVQLLYQAFTRAIEARGYHGAYRAIYPVKVNQQRSVIEQILNSGPGVGLEAGSKPELMAILGLIGDRDAVIVCNGYKDRNYVRLALIGSQLGQCIYLVVERLSELALIVQEARNLGVRPLLGMRVRLASIARGKWQNTGGERAKFGLCAAQAMKVLDCLRTHKLLDCMQLMHIHMGSQIPDIEDIRRGMTEASCYYAELRACGAELKVLDVGGGLGIDYEGTASRAFCSMNYTVQTYADTIIRTILDVCNQQNLPQPSIITEVGRAMTAHHAVLITNVIDVDTVSDDEGLNPPGTHDPVGLHKLWRLFTNPCPGRDIYREASKLMSSLQRDFSEGRLNLAQRAAAESLFYTLCLHKPARPIGEQTSTVEGRSPSSLADRYFCNFSVFQSMPDIWAFDQIFPIVPLHRLNEAPTREAILQDLTCDSDGQVQVYVGQRGTEATLPVHALRPDERYWLGFFLVGAYQEILGDQHNLFGVTRSVNVELQSDGDWRLSEASAGDTVENVLHRVRFDAQALQASYRRKLMGLKLDQPLRESFLRELLAGLSAYTYLED
jgi:arginine decarboxylase